MADLLPHRSRDLDGRPRPILVATRVTAILGLALVGIGALAGYAAKEIRFGFLLMAVGTLVMLLGYGAAGLWIAIDPQAAPMPLPDAVPA